MGGLVRHPMFERCQFLLDEMERTYSRHGFVSAFTIRAFIDALHGVRLLPVKEIAIYKAPSP